MTDTTAPRKRNRVRPLTRDKAVWDAERKSLTHQVEFLSNAVGTLTFRCSRRSRQLWLGLPTAVAIGALIGLLLGRLA